MSFYCILSEKDYYQNYKELFTKINSLHLHVEKGTKHSQADYHSCIRYVQQHFSPNSEMCHRNKEIILRIKKEYSYLSTSAFETMVAMILTTPKMMVARLEFIDEPDFSNIETE